MTADAMYHNIDFERIQARPRRLASPLEAKASSFSTWSSRPSFTIKVKQLLLALKANTAAEEIIAAIERGEKAGLRS